MKPFGKPRAFRGTPAQVMSAWMAELERAGCEVTKAGPGRLAVLVPGPESEVIAIPGGANRWDRWFWDRVIVTIAEDGSARFRWVYFTGPQRLFHAMAAAVAILGCLSQSGSFARNAAFFALLQLVPPLVAAVGFSLSLRKLAP